MSLLYDILYVILFIFYVPVLLVRGKLHKGYRVRFGAIGQDAVAKLKQRENLWFHAVSVGEVLALVELIKKVKEEYPLYQIVLTTVTRTGRTLACQNFKDDVLLYAPMDISGVIKKFIRTINPKVYIAAETEIWPNLYRSLHKENVPIIQVNGRISDQSFKGYQRFKGALQSTLKKVSLFCMQSDQDAQRVKEIGAVNETVQVTGNIKFDNLPEGAQLDRTELGYKPDDKIFIAGSTHANEEEILLKIFVQLKESESSLRLIISPRHIERSDEIKELIKSMQLNPVLLSGLDRKSLNQDDILIIDQIGVLKDFYSIASYVFIGKTLAVGGGQNMIEPAFFGKPILVGPMTYNFKDVVRIFLNEEALIQVDNEQELCRELGRLIRDHSRAQTIGHRANEVVSKYQGASNRTLEYIRPFLK